MWVENYTPCCTQYPKGYLLGWLSPLGEAKSDPEVSCTEDETANSGEETAKSPTNAPEEQKLCQPVACMGIFDQRQGKLYSLSDDHTETDCTNTRAMTSSLGNEGGESDTDSAQTDHSRPVSRPVSPSEEGVFSQRSLETKTPLLTTAKACSSQEGLLGRDTLRTPEGRERKLGGTASDSSRLISGCQTAQQPSFNDDCDSDVEIPGARPTTPRTSDKENERQLGKHLGVMLPKSGLTADERQSATDLILKYKEVFVGEDGQVGFTDKVAHKIDVIDSKPIRSRPYKTSGAERDELDRQIQQLLKDGKIEPSDSPWASPVIMVQKKDGTMRFCIDYRRLNSVTKKDAYPLPRIDDSLDALAGSKWFSTLDLASGYWQVAMDPKDRDKTAFCTHCGLFQWLVMPFGLSNAPATFERLMETVLGDIQWRHCLIYLDDVIAFGNDFQKALCNLEMVLKRLQRAHLRLKPKKCHLFEQSVEYLGHVVTAEGVKPCPSKVDAVRKWPPLTSVGDVRSFLGLCNYYRRFMKQYSEVSAPLTRLTRNDTPWHWGKTEQQAFENLKDLLTSDHVLAYPNRHGLFILDTDASLYGMGAVLSQMQDGEERVICYGSKSFSRSQEKYCTTKRELLAVVHFVTQYRSYLVGHHFVIRTDHASLLWLMNFKQSDNMYCNWIMKLEQYDYEIQHRAGDKHGNADGLSRQIPIGVGKHCGKPDCSHCATQRRTLSRPQRLDAWVPRDESRTLPLEKSDEQSPEEVVKGEGVHAPGLDTMSDLSTLELQDQDYLRDMASENFGSACPGRADYVCGVCQPYYVGADMAVVTRANARAKRKEVEAPEPPPEPSPTMSGDEEDGPEGRDLTRLGRSKRAKRTDPDRFPSSGDYMPPGPSRQETSRFAPSIHSHLTRKQLLDEVPTVKPRVLDPVATEAIPGSRVLDPAVDRLSSQELERATIVQECQKRLRSLSDVTRASKSLWPPALECLDYCYSPKDWAKLQQADPVLSRVRTILKDSHLRHLDEGGVSGEQPEVKAYLHLGSCLRIIEDVLVKEVYIPMPHELGALQHPDGERFEEMDMTSPFEEVFYAIVVPPRMRLGLFRDWHGRPESGHLSYKRLYPTLRKRFFWMGMARDLQEWLRACDSCQKIKGMGRHGTKVPMKTESVGAPMERVAVDVMGPWPTTPRGNRFIVIYQDYFSNWIEVFPLERHTAECVASVLVNEVISRYGAPLKLHSDQGREFESALYREICRFWGVKKTRTAPYTPWSNGKLERVNQTVKTMVKHYVSTATNDWDRWLPFLRMAYNFTVHDTTKCTPFRLMFSRCCEPTVPLDFIYGTTPKTGEPRCPLVFCEEQRLKGAQVFDVVRRIAKRSMSAQQSYVDSRGIKQRTYQPGELVLREYPPLSQTKLGHKYTGPWIVMSMVDTHNVEICRGGSPVVVHVSALKPYRWVPETQSQELNHDTDKSNGNGNMAKN